MSVVCDPTFECKILGHCNQIREEREFCDVILRSGACSFHAHRVILSNISDYFTVLFSHEEQFGITDIQFDEDIITKESLEFILNYAYTGKLDIPEDVVLDLIRAADYFDIQPIKSKCEDSLIWTDFTYDNLSTLVWFSCHLNLSGLLKAICKYISTNFFDISRECTLMSLSFQCFMCILNEKELTVFDNKIPVDDIDLELLKIVVQFSSENNLSANAATKLLDTINLSEIKPEMILSVVNIYPKLKQNDTFGHLMTLTELPFYTTGDNNFIDRNFSKTWKSVDEPNLTIEVNDRICTIKIYQFQGIPNFKGKTIPTALDQSSSSYGEDSELQIQYKKESVLQSRYEDIESYSFIVGLEITHGSGTKTTIGRTSQESFTPFDQIICEEFQLKTNEVITLVEMTSCCDNEYLSFIKFKTNLSNVFSLGERIVKNGYKYLYPDTHCGYLLTLKDASTINRIKPVWVEYEDPNERPPCSLLDDSFYDFDDDDDCYHAHYNSDTPNYLDDDSDYDDNYDYDDDYDYDSDKYINSSL